MRVSPTEMLHRWEWNLTHSSMPNFTPISSTIRAQDPQNWNFYLTLTKMWNISAAQGRILCAIFTKFAEFVPRFRMCQLLKFRCICSRGYRVMGVLSWGSRVPPNFRCPLAAKLRQNPIRFRGTRTCLRSSIGQKRWAFVSLSVCPSRFWMSEIVRPISPWRRWSTATILIPLDRRFVLVHLCSTFSDCSQLVTPKMAKSKNGKNWGFR